MQSLRCNNFMCRSIQCDRYIYYAFVCVSGILFSIGKGDILTLDLPVSCGRSQATQMICIHPAAFANAVCLLHVDDDKKSFRIEASRFWPHGACAKPEPSVLVSALEDIPLTGVVRESIIPLLWQVWFVLNKLSCYSKF